MKHMLCSASLAALSLAAFPALAQTAASTEIEEVVVTGSNIATSVNVVTNATPIEVISEKVLKSTSGESVATLLRSQPVSTGASLAPTNNEYTGGGSSVNLRGLGSAYTLVLIDGRRFGGEDVPDLDAVPAEGIQSIEILKNGASATYGSDAIAGVVNIKLKQRFHGLRAFASYGNTTDGDAGYKRAGLLFGTFGDRFEITGSVAVEDRNGMTKDDRELTASRDYRAYGGPDRRSTSVTTPNRLTVGGVNYTIDTSRLAPGQTGRLLSDYVLRTQATAVSTNEEGTWPPQKGVSGHWVAKYELFGEKLALFTDGYFSTRKQTFVALDSPVVSVNVPATNPYNPFGVAVAAVYKFGPNEFGPITEYFDTENLRGTVGLKGKLNGFSYEAGYTRYEKTVKEHYVNDISLAAAQAAANRTDATAFNPFGYWANGPSQLAGLSPTSNYKIRNQLSTYYATLSGPLFTLPAGEVRFAIGGEHRETKFDAVYDAGWKNTVYWWNGGGRTDQHRTRKSDTGFGELFVPILDRPDAAFVSSLEAGGAIRYEKYSDFGDATVKQANVRAGFLQETLYVRASWAESFRAPSLAQLYAAQSRNTEPGGFFFDPVRNGNLPVDRIVGGNTALKPERGESYNVGVVYLPAQVARLSLSLDYWKVEITDLIAAPDGQALLNGTSPSGSITRDPITQYPTLDLRLSNGGDRTAQGVDFGVSYGLPDNPFGQFTVTLNATYTFEFEDKAGAIVVDRLDNYSATFGPIPKWRGVGGLMWAKDGWDGAAFVRYTGSYKDILPGVVSRRVGDYVTTDLQLGYTFEDRPGEMISGLRLYGGAENVFDTTLPFVAASTDGWDRFLADYRGRYLYFGVSKTF